MEHKKKLSQAFDKIRSDLRSFIDLSLKEDETSWGDWIARTAKKIKLRCWETKKCNMIECPAFRNECGRCWLIAGTMCGGEVQGKFAKKYKSCRDCEIYQAEVLEDPISEMQEHLIVLVHSLRTKQMELKELAVTDHLTELYNRRYLDLVLAREMDKNNRNKREMALVIVDIDNFKIINDKHGHLQGDFILKECARILRDSVRATDLLVRLGGDEFLILMQDREPPSIEKLTQRINEIVHKWNEQNAQVDLFISLSMGSAPILPGADFDSVFKKADEDLYAKKNLKKHNYMRID